MRVLNITADYPDRFEPNKTLAVKLLLEGSSHTHYIYSINRTSNIFKSAFSGSDKLFAFRYFSLPLGFFLRVSLRILAKKIVKHIKKNNIQLDVIVAHKFTVEGILADYVSRELAVPYCLSLWGSTDRKFLTLKPELLCLYKGIYKRSKAVFPASPWILEYVESKLLISHKNVKLLPIVTENIKYHYSEKCKVINFVTIFNLDIYQLKGLPLLLESLASMNHFNWTLDIIGGGSEISITKVRCLIKKFNLNSRVFLKGKIDNTKITQILSGYHSFLMPTTSETYGMVYLEALYANIPILYSKKQGIDGYFNDLDFGVRVDPKSTEEIINGIEYLIKNRKIIIQNIRSSHDIGFFKSFEKKCIVAGFDETLKGITNVKENIT
ncbi:glycosyltransferase [Pseudoalteromonas tetraodonis]|uniref:glycosyltransferase n=1 Tax=Pseudoalteromonas tetraodonis TaxID=43659 RepID=UPI003CFF92B8